MVVILPLFSVFFASVCFFRCQTHQVCGPLQYCTPLPTPHCVCVNVHSTSPLNTASVCQYFNITPPSLLYSMRPLPWAVGILNWLCNYQMVKTSTSGSPSTVSLSVVLFCMRKPFANEPINRNVGNLQSNFCDQPRIIMYTGSGHLFLRSH